MGRRKKVIEEKEFIPSQYQANIFEYIQKGNGNLVIEAVAGSGKSTTLIQALKLIPLDKNILFCAFNKDIVTELERKIVKQDNINLSTIHSLGLKMLSINFKDEVSKVPNPTKYRSHISNNISEYSNMNLRYMSRMNFIKYMDNIHLLVQLLRLNLIDNAKDAMHIVERHDIHLLGDEVEVALDVMEWGKENIETVDYTDMVWLPNVLYCKPWGLQYDYIFVDEAQDLNIAQRELIFKCQKMGTRFIFAGDSNQAIYAFSGASPEAFKYLQELPNTISLPLSISYRCSKNVVKFAQNYVPKIEYKDDAIDGEILYNVPFNNIQDGDMILCRNNAPLLKLYSEMLKLDKKCFIRGKDIGDNLIALVNSTKQKELNSAMNKDGVFVRLYSHLFDTRDKMMTQFNIDKHDAMETTICSELLDKIKALEILSENIDTVDELKAKIKGIFSDKKKEGISLSTIHKAKGLEANNVYIACRSLMPSKSAKQPWTIVQEHNLIYVAYTRAKDKLGFLSEDEFKNFTSDEAKFTLDNIERKINLILNKNISSGVSFNKTAIEEIIKRKTPIRESNIKTITPNISATRQPLSLGRRKISELKKEIYR